jgi:Mrp family chromosome partitioning ATPase
MAKVTGMQQQPAVTDDIHDGRTVVLSRAEIGGIDKRLVVVRRPNGDQAAAYRLLAHQLFDDEPKGKRILVTSAKAESGKTVCAANLAAAYGELVGMRPVLLDLNFRAPSVATFFGLKETPVSLYEYLAGDGKGVLKLANIDKINVSLAALDPDEPPRRLTDATPLAPLFVDLQKAGFGPLIIDGPATLGSVEANLILDRCDGAVLVARVGKTRARDVKNAQLQLSPERILGIVLSDS